MDWLNYHHLYYFWTVAREGTIARACKTLYLTQSTISGQLSELERALQTKLFDRVGRNLVLTESGRMVYRYANDIFALGQDLREALNGRSLGQGLRLEVGIADALPRWIVYNLLEPAFKLPGLVKLDCHDDTTERLLSRLILNELDIVLSDTPASPIMKVRVHNHLLGECGVSFFGTPKLTATYRRGFPKSLDGAPMLLPMAGTAFRSSLDDWFGQLGIRPRIRCEVSDADLFEVIAHGENGLYAAPSVMEARVRRHFNLQVVGRAEEIREKYYAITTERRLKHPAVIAISEVARCKLFK